MAFFRRLPFDGPTYGRFHGTWLGRVQGPFGCLVALVLCPIGLAIGAVVALSLAITTAFGLRRRTRATWRAAVSPEGAAREQALRRLVEAMALDETFTAEEARQAGTLALPGGATVDDLLADALERRWIEVRGERLAVTQRGREETSGPALPT